MEEEISTHWTCNNRLIKEGEEAACCLCNPHGDEFDCGDDEEINKFKEQPKEWVFCNKLYKT